MSQLNLNDHLKGRRCGARPNMKPRTQLISAGDIHSLPPQPPMLRPWRDYQTADQLVQTCPSESEMHQIRNDFNVYFDKGLVDNGILTPWSCSDGGTESSIILSMYNGFRLLNCIPFDSTFPWDSRYSNLYKWLKDLSLNAIGFFWAQDSAEDSWGWDKEVHLIGNNLGNPIYREIINSQSGIGIIYTMVLLVHEARHAGYNIGHNCTRDNRPCDTNLAYMGAWAVQYYLLKMLSENTGTFFTAHQKESLGGSAQDVLENDFCSNPP